MTHTLREFNQFFEKNHQRFVRFADSYLHDTDEAEDIVLDSMMAYWSNRETLAEDTNVSAYVLTIVKNRCLNHLRRLETINSLNSDFSELQKWELELRINSLEGFEPSELYSKEIYDIMQKTLSVLPSKTRRVFELSRIEQKSHREISDILDISEKSIEYHIMKATAMLRMSLKDYLPMMTIYFLLM